MNKNAQHLESVWDYPRPPRVEPSTRRVRVIYADTLIVDTHRAVRVLETSHPPVYYVPLADVQRGSLVSSQHQTFCEFKGAASYVDLVVGDHRSPRAGWLYEHPSRGFEQLAGLVAFYPGRVDRCLVDEEVVRPQEGDFYGGWITDDITGPFKGGPGTRGW
jgi:uncharacterized protein (DUF427 family)